MYACSCRALREGEIRDFLDKLPPCLINLKLTWEDVSEKVSGEPVNCGACIKEGQEMIDNHIKNREPAPQ